MSFSSIRRIGNGLLRKANLIATTHQPLVIITHLVGLAVRSTDRRTSVGRVRIDRLSVTAAHRVNELRDRLVLIDFVDIRVIGLD